MAYVELVDRPAPEVHDDIDALDGE
jgi:hypothetical protein